VKPDLPRMPLVFAIDALLGLILCVAASGADLGNSQHDLSLPGIASTPVPEPSSVPFVVPPSGSQTLEIPLPETFHGCWNGTVEQTDSRKSFSWRPIWLVPWKPKNYKFCFIRRGLNQWVLTYAETSLGKNVLRIKQESSTVRFLRMDGASTVLLDVYTNYTGNPHSQVWRFSVEELAHLRCTIDGALLHIQANLFAWRDGSPSMEATWHTALTKAE
jgi:hypothetical protein